MPGNSKEDIGEVMKLLTKVMEKIETVLEKRMDRFEEAMAAMMTRLDKERDFKTELEKQAMRIKQIENELEDLRQEKISNEVILSIPKDKVKLDDGPAQAIRGALGGQEPSGTMNVSRVHVGEKICLYRLKFNDSKNKSEFLAKRKEFKSNKIFVNENLTKRNQILFKAARALLKNGNIKYVWTKDCKILIRRSDKSPVEQVKSLEDLEKYSK